jgi:hypothetical protein
MNTLTKQPEIAPSEARNYDLSVADAIWLAAAIQQHAASAHQQEVLCANPIAADHLLAGLVKTLHLTKATDQSVLQHIRQHCVANKEPKPNRSCVLFMTEAGVPRLYRDSDPRHPRREGAAAHPKWENLPDEFQYLREWYETVWNSPSALIANDPLLNAIGTGKGLFGDQGADAYVHALREGWGDRP